MTNVKMDNQNYIKSLYREILKRPPSTQEIGGWLEYLHSPGRKFEIAKLILESEEYQQRFLPTESPEYKKLLKLAKDRLSSTSISVVDIGAQNLENEDHIYCELLDEFSCNVIGFEPLNDKIIARIQHDKKNEMTLFPYAIGDGNEHLFHINNDDTTSSLLKLKEKNNRELVDLSKLRTVDTQRIETKTLDEF